MNIKTALIIAVSLTAISSRATVYFQNSGSTSGWGELKLEKNASITQQPSCYKGTTGLRFVTTWDPNYTGRYHTECRIKNNNYSSMNLERYVGWAFWYSPNWVTVNTFFNMQQFIANWTPDDNTCTTVASPTTMTWLQGSSLKTRVKYGTVCHQTVVTYTFTSSFSKGVWHRIVLRGKWKNDNTGIFEGWLDGTKVFSRVNAPTWMAGSNTGMTFCIGMYANGWTGGAVDNEPQPTRTWFIDSIRIASSLAEADPVNW